MKVVDKRTKNIKVAFADLPVGQAYFDEDDVLCIKTSTYDEDNCICYQDGYWNTDHQYGHALVMPTKVTLTIEG